ncbi:MAG: VOC family protein [Elusimicrobia bacterium]|nr:VOC family protein [Elusimicrobiota bacterium]
MERQSATNSPVKLGFVILYVKDQASSARFYSRVLAQKPTLDVPGMTEFTLENGFKFGLMSEKGIAGLLGPALPDPSKGSGIPRAEIYIKVADPQAYHQRALDSGAREISPLQPRPWGDRVAYSIDPDGHVLAFAGD